MSDWQAMGSAKKNGRAILAYGGGQQYVCWWSDTFGMWINNEVSEIDGDVYDQEPDLWMPLPAPPTATQIYDALEEERMIYGDGKPCPKGFLG